MRVLVICESPAKINKLQKFLNNLKSKNEYIVKASYGHFRDLNKKEISIDFDNNYNPIYSLSNDKKHIIKELKTINKKCDMVYLASDYDREGEAIAWHLKETLKLDDSNYKRILFTEITSSAIKKSIENLTKIDINMFYAQQARRVLDRLIGYLISPILWKQIQNNFKEKISLSAGRVQSVVVKLIIERENEINKFSSNCFFKVNGLFNINNINLTSELNCDKNFTNEKQITKFIQKCQDSKFIIKDITKKETKRKPPLPFITSSLQQEASNKLGISPKETMSIAQKLYENGFITYMRTDSYNLSDEAHNNIKNKIIKEFGEEYYKLNKKKSGKNSQEAHEACRPTDFNINTLEDNNKISYRENRLYKLIWLRTIASQMKDTIVDIINFKISIIYNETPLKYMFISKNEFIKFRGYLKVFEFQQVENSIINSLSKEDLLKIKKNTQLDYLEINADEKYSKPSQARFTEASIIKRLDELGIGRPSTYATIISNIQDRKYIIKKTIKGEEKECLKIKIINDREDLIIEKIKIKIGGAKDKLVPTDIGIIVNTFLLEHFKEILDYKFTADIEEELDKIALGKTLWYNIIHKIFILIKPKLDEFKISTTKEKDKYLRIIGKYPNTDYDITTYIGPYGPVLKLNEPNNIKYIPLKEDSMKDITLDKALDLLKYPLDLGKYYNKDIKLCNGKFGIYLKYNNKNYSILEELKDDRTEITLDIAMDIIKNSNNGNRIIKFDKKDLEIKTGQYGPYFNYNKKNYSIPKNYNLLEINEDDIKRIVNYKKSNNKNNDTKNSKQNIQTSNQTSNEKIKKEKKIKLK